MDVRVKELRLRGFKTFKSMWDADAFRPGPLSVLIGANGAGKSNFISFFRLISWMTGNPPELQSHVGIAGGASAILHDGADKTREIEAVISIETSKGINDYSFRLVFAAGDTLIFAEEKYRHSSHDRKTQAPWIQLEPGLRESRLVEQASGDNKAAQTAAVILDLLSGFKVFQFHNTSFTARMRTKWDEEDNRHLKEDGANLAPFLRRLQTSEPAYYQRVVATIRQIVPFFADFELVPDHGRVLLQWRERGSDVVFNASQASDGMLRVMALIALLQQPERDLPKVLILDEPELGLHPYAIAVVAGLLQSVSNFVQVLVATQSMTMIDYFSPEEIVVVNRSGRESILKRLDSNKLAEWLEEYSLSELWEKNVIGGRPAK